MNLRYLFLLIATFFYYSSISQVNSDSKIFLKNNCKKPLQLYYIDNLYFGHPIFFKELETLFINTNQSVYIFCTDKNQHFIKVFPGDSVSITERKNSVFLETSQKRALNLFFNKSFEEIGPLRLLPTTENKDTILTLQSRDLFFKSLYLRRLNLLNQVKPQLEFDEFMEAYSLIKSLSILEKIKIPALNFNIDTIKAYYIDSIESFNSQLNSLENYPLNPLLRETLLKVVENRIINKPKSFNVFEWIDSSYTHNFKSFLLARKIKEYLDSKVKNISTDSIPLKYLPLIKDSNLKNELVDLYKFKIKKDFGTSHELDILTTKNEFFSIKKVIEKNASYPIYVDLWASWCLPCISEFKNSEKLIQKFPNIKFIFLSLDENFSKWLNSQSKYNFFTKENSFLLLDDFNSKFAKQLRLKEIPRYLLISKTGKIINTDAPRPSDVELVKMLENL